MDETPSRQSLNTFVVRIWREWSPTDSHWYGRIENLQNGQQATFRDLERIAAFIRAACALSDDAEGDHDHASGYS